jgi:hypothetical protein
MSELDRVTLVASEATLAAEYPAEHGDCQLQVLYGGATELTWSDRLRNRLLRLRSYFRDYLGEAVKRLRGRQRVAPIHAGLERAGYVASGSPLAAGDVVEVLTWDEIRRTLDEHDRCEGLRFMKAMAEHCGKRYVVLTHVRTIFDERQWKMVHPRHTVLLRDVYCRGVYMADREGCDRRCFFFWKEKWLRKV